MPNLKNESSVEYFVLKIMNESDGPLGAGAVGEKLAEQNISIRHREVSSDIAPGGFAGQGRLSGACNKRIR